MEVKISDLKKRVSVSTIGELRKIFSESTVLLIEVVLTILFWLGLSTVGHTDAKVHSNINVSLKFRTA